MKSIIQKIKLESYDWFRSELGREPNETESKAIYANFLNMKINTVQQRFKIKHFEDLIIDILDEVGKES